jgi:cytochrome c oxidase cbb3-type subunit 4
MTAFFSNLNDTAWNLVALLWTPVCVVVFLLIVVYALWPKNRKQFDDAARMPLRED